MPKATAPDLELNDIQAGALLERPSPYVGTYLMLRIANRADGRELVRRLNRIATTSQTTQRGDHTSLTVAFTYHGLEALGVPQPSLDSFAPEFREGMAARAAVLGDVGESSPQNWESPLGSANVHVAIAVLSADAAGLEDAAEKARLAHAELPGLELIWRQDCYQLATGRTSFGFKDGIGQPAIEGERSADHESPGAAPQSWRDHPGLPRRDRRVAADADAGGAGSQRHLRRVTKTAHQGGGLPSLTCATGPRAARRRTFSVRRWSGAGRAALRWLSPRTATTPSSVPILDVTTTFSSATTREGSSARSVPTPGGQTRATLWTTTAAWTSGCIG